MGRVFLISGLYPGV